MGRQRPTRSQHADTGQAPGPAAGEYVIDTGTCELQPDQFNASGWILNINGVPSSHIDLNDPLRLDFEYMRWIAALVDSRWDAQARLRTLHLGGGACSLARSIATSHPQARQVVVELDGKLAEMVRTWFDLPRAPLLRIRVGEAREVTESLTEKSRDLIIRDVFAGSRTPYAVTTAEFAGQVQRVLADDGVYVVNCGDAPDLRTARQEAATISSVFAHCVIIADSAMLKGRRSGNVIIAGSGAPLGDQPGLARTLLGGGVPAQLRRGDDVLRFAGGAAVLRDR